MIDVMRFYTASIAAIFALLIYPLYEKIRITPPGFIYTLTQFKIIDFYIYTAIMRQGHTQWMMQDPGLITDEQVPRNLVNVFYILLGKFAHVLSIPDGWMYYISHYVGAFALIVSIILLLRLILPQNLRRIAFVLVFFGGTFPRLLQTAGGFILADAWPWTLQWESAYHRLMHVPAHLFVEILVILSFIFLMHSMRQNTHSIRYAFVAGTLMFFGTIFFAPLALPLLIAVVGSTILYYVPFASFSKVKRDTRKIFGIVVFALLTILGLLIMHQSIKNGNPSYQRHIAISEEVPSFEQASVKAYEYLRIFWLFLPFIFLSLPAVFARWTWERIFIFTYFLTPFLLIFIGPIVGIESWRAANSMPFLTAGVLTSFGIDNLLKLRRLPRSLREVAKWGIVLAILAISFVQNWFYYQREVKPVFTTQSYIPVSWDQAMHHLAAVAPPRSVVLSLEHIAMMLPTYGELRGYGMKDYNERWFNRGGALDPEIEAFYRGNMTEEQARRFLRDHHIRYVFFGWHEMDLAKELHYQSLQPIFRKPEVVLYQVVF